MSLQFKKYQEHEASYNRYTTYLDHLLKQLAPFSGKIEDDFHVISRIPEQFKKKINDFYQKDRKLRIGIIGQIKAGKSSFLNTLLFNGEHVLPEASTPKTANLTVIQYGEKNKLEIEFYLKEEWQELVELSKSDLNITEVQVAKETMELIKALHLDPYEYVGTPPLVIHFDTYNELLGKLNDYAGDNGQYTPIVKSLNLFINDEKVKNIVIVDTPGMNDPIPSRTEKTRQYIELTDVVFYLSMAEKFLDKEDVNLLIRQLPEKGAKRIIVIASKYDSAIIDDSMDRDSLEEVEANLNRRLPARAKDVFHNKITELEKRNPHSKVREVLENSLPPLLVSARAHNLAMKQKENYSSGELKSLQELNELWYGFEFSREDLLRIGNMPIVVGKLDEVIAEKDEILIEKSRDFIPDSAKELFGILQDCESRSSKRIAILEQDNLAGIQEQQKIIQQKKHGIMAGVEEILGSINFKVENKKVEVSSDSKRMMREFITLPERTGSEEKERYYEVSNAKLFKPWTWFSKERKSESYVETYQYLDISDAIANVRHYSNEVSISIERIFSELINPEDIRRSLTGIIIQNFDGERESFDPAYFRFLVEKSISSIQFPVIHIDLSHHLQSLTVGFTGEIRNASEKSTLLTRLSSALASVFDLLEKVLLQETEAFKQDIEKIKSSLVENLLTDIQKEVDLLKNDFKNKTEELAVYVKILKVLETEKKELISFFIKGE